MRHALLSTCAVLAINGFGLAFAASDQDAAFDKNSKTVSDSFGHCVRTKWMGDTDPCRANAPKVAAPVAAPAPVAVDVRNITEEQRTVYFDFNQARLTPAGKSKLDILATAINNSKEVSDVSIHGYTDQLGTTSYNDALASKRAAAVKAYLDSKSRLKTTVGDVRGFGKSSPEAQCSTIKARAEKIACMATERRVEVEMKLAD